MAWQPIGIMKQEVVSSESVCPSVVPSVWYWAYGNRKDEWRTERKERSMIGETNGKKKDMKK
jgi:hypothetical protein